MDLLFWCQLTLVILEKRPLNKCSVAVIVAFVVLWFPALLMSRFRDVLIVWICNLLCGHDVPEFMMNVL